MEKKLLVAFCSPSGSTRHVARVLEADLRLGHAEVAVLDLGGRQDWEPARDMLRAAPAGSGLFVGSPVYKDLAVPPVMRFIDTLPDMEGKFAVPFVTWGAACSGIALWQMARALTSKGCRIAGAAKVCGEHSLTFQRDEPVGKGRPSAEDDRVVRELAHKVMDDYLHGDGAGLPLESLDYQPAERADEMKRKLVEPPPLIGRSVDEAACTQCGICVDNCPVEAVQLTPFPEFGSRCFDCFTCMKTCPEDAIKPAIPLDKIVSMIEKRVETIGERPLTHVFV